MKSDMLNGMAAIRSLCVLGIVALMLVSPSVVFAEGGLSVTPVLIDEKGKPRDIIKQSLTIVNNTERKLNLFPAVNDVTAMEGEQEFARAQNSDDRAVSLANWIELSRGSIELGPGEEKTIPFVIRVNLNAVTGAYHAKIALYEGSTREMAEANAPIAETMVNVEIQPDVKEMLQLNKFFTESLFFSGDDVLFNYQIENIGNQDLQPKGDIRIYDRKGKEVAAIDVNDEGKTVSPDEMSQLASVWSAASGFGRYKAFINIDYGSQKASVQDTVYFWIVPWQQLLGFTVAMMIALVFLALYVHRWLDARYHAHYARLHGTAPVAAAVLSHETREAQEQYERKPRKIFALLSKVKDIRLPRIRRASSVVAEEVPAPKQPVVEKTIRSIPQAEPVKATPTSVAVPTPVAPQAVATAGTIDLKNLGSSSTVPRREQSHVINLKNPN